MLDGFDPYLLVIANRVIYKSDNVTLINKSDNLKIFNGHDFSFEIGKSDSRIKVGMSFKYRGYPFIFNDKCSIFPGNGHLKNVQLSNAKAAISWNMWQS
jgi:hypothetical protein